MIPDKEPKQSAREEAMYSISVYLDDFIGAAVENVSGTFLGRISKADLHNIHSIPPPPPTHIG